MSVSPEMINAVIRHRRTIKPSAYTGGAVDDAIVRQMLENANWAPTHGLTEPWRFKVFTGAAREVLGAFQAAMYKSHTPEAKFRPEKYAKSRTSCLRASHVIAVAIKRQAIEKIPEIEEVAAVACAVQNMLLTAAAYGVGAYWSTGGATYTPEARAFFGLGPKDKPMGFVYVGALAEGPLPEGKRRPIEHKTEWLDAADARCAPVSSIP